MKTRGLSIAAVALGLAVAVSPAAAQQQAVTVPALTFEEMEAFLSNAQIKQIRPASGGVTNSQRATLTDGRLTHDAHIQTINTSAPVFRGTLGTEINFRDSYAFNIAAYRLARHLGLSDVPATVERRVNGASASVTWWVDNVQMDEGARRKKNVWGPDPQRTAMQIHVMRVFDALIANTDRNSANLLWTTDWKMWMIDHTRAFRLAKRLLNQQSLERCERRLFENMKALTLDDLQPVLGESVGKQEIEALLVRRDLIVKLFDEMIAKKGETGVLYTIGTS